MTEKAIKKIFFQILNIKKLPLASYNFFVTPPFYQKIIFLILGGLYLCAIINRRIKVHQYIAIFILLLFIIPSEVALDFFQKILYRNYVRNSFKDSFTNFTNNIFSDSAKRFFKTSFRYLFRISSEILLKNHLETHSEILQMISQLFFLNSFCNSHRLPREFIQGIFHKFSQDFQHSFDNSQEDSFGNFLQRLLQKFLLQFHQKFYKEFLRNFTKTNFRKSRMDCFILILILKIHQRFL